MEDDYRTPWVFESTMTDPTGLKVHVAVTVPPSAEWEDVAECGEYAQMNASRAIAQIRKNRKDCQMRCPF